MTTSLAPIATQWPDTIEIAPVDGPVSGTAAIPGSKSITYRALVTALGQSPQTFSRRRLVPWADALTALCKTIDGQDIDWWLTGSAALAVRGMTIEPGDLDLVVARESAARFEALLLDTVVEPPRPGWISDTFTRGFLRACIEWIAGVDERADGHMVGDVGPVAASRLETVTWRGFPIRVPPLDLQLAVNEARGLDARATWIRSAMTRAASR